MPSARAKAAFAAALAFVGTLAPAVATAQTSDAAPEPWDVSALETSLLSAVSLAGVWGFSKLRVRPSSWSSELLPWDERVKDNVSASAARLADGSLALSIALPLAVSLGDELDRRDGERLLLYGQALSLNLLLVGGAKYLVQRPRPYTYNQAPLVRDYASRQGDDAYLSFFSGHSSTAFTAAVAGSYLYGMESDDANARASVWGANIAVAALTANLRVRAGQHFYSDIAVGAVVGAGIGIAVPLLHATEDGAFSPSGREWLAMGTGLALGTVAAHLLPLPSDVPATLETRVEPAPYIVYRWRYGTRTGLRKVESRTAKT